MFRLSEVRRIFYFLFGQLGTVFHSRFFAVAEDPRCQQQAADFRNGKKSSVQAGLREQVFVSDPCLGFIGRTAFVICPGFRNFIIVVSV